MHGINKMKIIKVALLICISAMFTACSSFFVKNNTDEIQVLDVYVFGDKDINPNLLAEPSPIKISILQMTTEVEFNQMNELNLKSEYRESLGGSVLNEMNVIIRPDEHLDFKIPLNAQAKYLGVVAAYREQDKAWKQSFFKQDKKWYQTGGNFLYLNVKNNGFIPLSKKEALTRIMDKKLEEDGRKLSDLTEKQKKKMKENLEKLMDSNKKADLKKGVYKQSPVPVAVKAE